MQNENDFFDKINSEKLKDLVFVTQDYLKPYLKFIRENKSAYRASFRSPDIMQANVRYKD